MTVLFLQDHRIAGGAARAAWRSGWALHRSGHRVVHVTGDYRGTNFRETHCLSGKPPRGWFRVWESLTGSREKRRQKVEARWQTLLQKIRPDVVWVHNLAGGSKWGWSAEMVSMARNEAPVVWTLHDMRALGDGPDYFPPAECAARSSASWLLAEEKRSARHSLVVTAPSRWLAGLATQVLGRPAHALSNPLPLEIFRVRDRASARRVLGLPAEGRNRIVLAIAEDLRDPRKGMEILREAWSRLPRGHGATLCLAGRGAGEWPRMPGVVGMGKTDAPSTLACLYAAADLVALPSRLENAPCVIQESLACGTPVLAFRTGGIGEMIQPGRTGWLVDPENPDRFGDQLAEALEVTGHEPWTGQCRRFAEDHYAPEIVAAAWSRLVGAEGIAPSPGKPKRSPEKPGPTVDLRLGGGGNPYHWLIYHLGALLELERRGQKPTRLVLEPLERDFQALTLESLGFRRAQWEVVPRPRKVPGTFAPPEIQDGPQADLGWLYGALRDQFLPQAAGEGSGARLLISRRDASRARLENEDEIFARLAPLGFRRICPGEMAWPDQLAAFARAEILVAVHGAALVHLLFSSPGTRVLEMFPSEDDTHGFDGILRHGGLLRRKLMGTEERRGRAGAGFGFWVDPALVEAECREWLG